MVINSLMNGEFLLNPLVLQVGALGLPPWPSPRFEPMLTAQLCDCLAHWTTTTHRYITTKLATIHVYDKTMYKHLAASVGPDPLPW